MHIGAGVVYGFCIYLSCIFVYVVLVLIYSLTSFIFVIKTYVKFHLCVSLAPAEKNPLVEKARERESKLKRARDTFPENTGTTQKI